MGVGAGDGVGEGVEVGEGVGVGVGEPAATYIDCILWFEFIAKLRGLFEPAFTPSRDQ